MTIHLPEHVERSIDAAVKNGRFSSPDAAVAAAWQAFTEGMPQAKPAGRMRDGIYRESIADALFSEMPESSQDRIQDDEVNEIKFDLTPVSIPADSRSLPEGNDRPIWEVIDELSGSLPEEVFLSLPEDGARQIDHYLHGSPKRPS